DALSPLDSRFNAVHPRSVAISHRPFPHMRVLRFVANLIILFMMPAVAAAEWHVTGVAGTFSRVQADRLNFSSFHSGPTSTTTPVIGLEGGRSLWKLTIDGTLMRTRTGQTLVIGP